MNKYIIVYFSSFLNLSSQTIIKDNLILYYESCNTYEISMCGNYFDQINMRLPVLINVNENEFFKSYDTIYKLDIKQVLMIERLINSRSPDLNIVYPKSFFKFIKSELKRNNNKEKPNKIFRYYKILMSFEAELIEDEVLYILNPNAKNEKNLYIEYNTISYKIVNFVKIEFLDNQKKTFRLKH